MRGSVVNRHVGILTNSNSASQFLHFDWAGAMEAIRKLLKRCQKVVTNKSKTLCSGNSMTLAPVSSIVKIVSRTPLGPSIAVRLWGMFSQCLLDVEK